MKREKEDLKRCQAFKPNDKSSFSLGGVPKMIRCENLPSFILTESKPDKDGDIGSMSVCKDCCNVALEQLPKNTFFISKI